MKNWASINTGGLCPPILNSISLFWSLSLQVTPRCGFWPPCHHSLVKHIWSFQQQRELHVNTSAYSCRKRTGMMFPSNLGQENSSSWITWAFKVKVRVNIGKDLSHLFISLCICRSVVSDLWKPFKGHYPSLKYINLQQQPSALRKETYCFTNMLDKNVVDHTGHRTREINIYSRDITWGSQHASGSD